MPASTRIPLAAITQAGAAKWLLDGIRGHATKTMVTRHGDAWLLHPEGVILPDAAVDGYHLDTTDPLVQTAVCLMLLRLKRISVPDYVLPGASFIAEEHRWAARLVVGEPSPLDVALWDSDDVPALAACTTIAEALAAVVMWEIERAGEGR